jgi:WD40 repeat protein
MIELLQSAISYLSLAIRCQRGQLALLAASATVLATACLPLPFAEPKKSDSTLKSLQLPLWTEALSDSSLSSATHLGEVLTAREVASSPLRVASAGGDGNVILWSLGTGSGQLLKQVGGPMQHAALGRRHALVAWSSGSKVSVACVAGCDERWDLTRLKTRTTSLGFHEDDSALLIGGADGRVYRWHFQRERLAESQDERDRSLERYIAHQTLLSAIAPLHSGRVFFSADWDGRLYAWLAYTADDHQGGYDRNLFGGRFFGSLGSYMYAARAADRGITSLAISENGQRLAVGTDDGYVEVWEVRGFEVAARSLIHTGRVISVSLSNDGSRVASLGRDGIIAVSDVVPDASYGIKAGALRSITTEVFREEMKSARSVYFLSTGDLLLSTDAGQLGEIQLSSKARAAPPPPLRITPGAATTEKGTDY